MFTGESNIINIITNILAVVLVIGGALQEYLTTQPFNWLTFTFCVVGALVAYFTGKSAMVKKS